MNIKEGKNLRRFAGGGLAAVLAVMLVFTVLSRVMASFTVPKVGVEKPSFKKIEHIVKASGSVEENRETAVLTEPEILVKTVYVKTGEKVKEGDLLAELDMEHINERISEMEDEIRILKLKNDAELAEQKQTEVTRQTQRRRAEEDYAQAVADGEAAAAKAAEELQSAKDAYYSYTSAHEGDSSGEVYAQMLSLLDTMKAKQNTYDLAVQNHRNAVQEAERAVEDANTDLAVNHSSEINQIQITGKEQKLQELQELAAQEGKLSATADSVVMQVNIAPGQKTSDTAALTLADLNSGLRYKAQIEKENVKYVSVGDEVTLDRNGEKITGLTVDTAETKEDGALEITVLLLEGELTIGDTATLELKKQSAQSQTSVPLTALHEEEGVTYVYILDTMDTVLGESYTARRLSVSVLDKNSEFAALEEGVLSADDSVITDSDRYFEAGSRVRL